MDDLEHLDPVALDELRSWSFSLSTSTTAPKVSSSSNAKVNSDVLKGSVNENDGSIAEVPASVQEVL